MSKTNAELRGEVRDLVGVPDFMAGSSQLRSGTLEVALEQIGGTPWGGAPSLRAELRDELGLSDPSEHDSSGFRKADLVALRDRLQEVDDE